MNTYKTALLQVIRAASEIVYTAGAPSTEALKSYAVAVSKAEELQRQRFGEVTEPSAPQLASGFWAQGNDHRDEG